MKKWVFQANFSQSAYHFGPTLGILRFADIPPFCSVFSSFGGGGFQKTLLQVQNKAFLITNLFLFFGGGVLVFVFLEGVFCCFCLVYLFYFCFWGALEGLG